MDALAAPPSLVLVEGEPGIGKTRLLRETLASPRLADRTVLIVACPPLAEPFPLGPVIDGLRRLHSDVGGVGLSPLGGALRPLFPEWAERLPSALETLEDPKETRHRVLRALTELVERLYVDVLVVEDAHWADTSTLEWLLTITTSEDPALSVVVTYRPTDIPEGSLLLRLTSRSPAGMRQLRAELEPLDVEQSRRLVGSMLGADEVSEEFGSFLHDRTDGIPLAIEETVRLLRDREDIARRDGTWTRRIVEELQVPPRLRDSVLERVERMPSEARRVLDAAAVLATPADEATLTVVAGLDEDAGRSGLAAALASGLIEETKPGRYVFRHALDVQAIKDAIPIPKRRHLHASAAAVLAAQEPTPVARLADHYREAGDAEQWCLHAEASADLALESGDDYIAVAVLLDLLTTMEHPADRRARLASKLAEAAYYRATSLGDLVERLIDALRSMLAEDGLPPLERGLIRLLLGRLLQSRDVDVSAELIEAALPDLHDRPAESVQAMLLMAFPSATSWPVARHLEWLERATAALPRLGSDPRRLWYVIHRAAALLLLGQEAGWEAAAEIPLSASSAREGRTVAHGAMLMAQMAITWGRYANADRWLDTATELAEAFDARRTANATLVTRAYLDYYTGAWNGLAETAADLADSPETNPLERVEATLIHALADVGRGDHGQAEQRLRMIGDEFARGSLIEPPTLTQMAALGRLHLHDDEAEQARLVTEPGTTRLVQKGLWLWATDIAPVHLDALAGVGELGRATDLVRAFGDGLDDLDAPAPASSLITCRAILAEAHDRLGKAADLFGAAAQAWAALPRPYDELLALERQGRCMLTSGRKDEALVVLSDAQRRLSELGARWDADRVAHQLRQHGVEVARAWRGGRRGYGDQLSPRELEVVRLVSKGMTSREVGEVLFLSPRTVDLHLRNAMRKLDVRSRTALVATAAEAGLLSGDNDRQ